MKKVLVILLIISGLTVGSCFADVSSDDEDIEQYFQLEDGASDVVEQAPLKSEDVETPSATPDGTSFQNEEPVAYINGSVEYNYDEETQEEDKDAIYLNDSALFKQINFTKPKTINNKKLAIEARTPTFEPFKEELNKASKFSSPDYLINPVNSAFVQKIGNFSLGTAYEASMSSAQVNYATSVFAKYDWKLAALTTTFVKSTDANYSYTNTIKVAPELKLTKHLSILDVAQTDVDQINKKNEIVLRYKPNFTKYADAVEFEIGAGQSFYNNTFVKSSLRFSTNVKF